MTKKPSLSRLLNVLMTDRARVEGAVRGRTGEVASADIVQETWLKLANHQPDSAIENPSAFVRRVARNTATDYLRKERRRSALNTEVHHLLYDTEDELSPERIVIGRQAAAIVREAINSLPPQTRRVLLMSRFEGMTHRDIALELGISEAAVYYHIRRAFEHLAAVRSHLPD